MKKKIKAPNRKGEYVDRYIQYIPARYIFAILITILEIIMVIGIVFLCAIYIPYFYIALYVTVIGVVISIIVSNENPDYKIPWLLCVICIPIIGFMLYFLFYKRKLTKKLIKKLNAVNESLEKDNEKVIHRVIEIDYIDGKTRYYTKGDANEEKDDGYILDSQIIGLTNYKLSYLGYPTLWIHDIFK